MDIHTLNSPDGMVSQKGYINLIKASWILIDIITRHPQLSFLYSDVQLEVEMLAGVRIPSCCLFSIERFLTSYYPHLISYLALKKDRVLLRLVYVTNSLY